MLRDACALLTTSVVTSRRNGPTTWLVRTTASAAVARPLALENADLPHNALSAFAVASCLL